MRGNRCYPEETGSHEHGPGTSKLHQHDAFPFARLGLLRFFLFILHSLCFQFPYGLAPTHNWYLNAGFFFSPLLLLSVEANAPRHSAATFEMPLYRDSESGNWWFAERAQFSLKRASKQ